MASLQEFLIAMGGNLPSQLGPPAETLRAAVTRLGALGVEVETVSRFYTTPCFPAGFGPDYVNAAARCFYDGTPANLLSLMHKVENEFRRDRVRRWGQRTLDLDLLAAGQSVLPDAQTYAAWCGLPLEAQMQDAPDQLVLPHPRLHERAFVLVPLCDVASQWEHPVLKKTVAEMVSDLDQGAVAEVVPI